MRKVIAMILVLVVFMMMGSAFADDCGKAYSDLMEYIEVNELHEYKGTFDQNNYYQTIGQIFIDEFMEIMGIDENPDEFERWFCDEYEKTLMQFYPEYGEVSAAMTKIAVYNGTDIWHINITAEHDIVDWVDGDQCGANMLVVFT